MADDGERERKMKITVIGDTGAQCFSALGTGGNLAPRRARLKVVRKQNAALDALNAAFVTHRRGGQDEYFAAVCGGRLQPVVHIHHRVTRAPAPAPARCAFGHCPSRFALISALS